VSQKSSSRAEISNRVGRVVMKIREFQPHASLAWKCLFTPRRSVVTRATVFEVAWL